MTLEQILNFLIQLPIVAIFIWYVDRSNKIYSDTIEHKDQAFLSFLTDERRERQKMSEQLNASIRGQEEIISAFRGEMNAAIQVMRDRTERREDTQPLPKKRGTT